LVSRRGFCGESRAEPGTAVCRPSSFCLSSRPMQVAMCKKSARTEMDDVAERAVPRRLCGSAMRGLFEYSEVVRRDSLIDANRNSTAEKLARGPPGPPREGCQCNAQGGRFFQGRVCGRSVRAQGGACRRRRGLLEKTGPQIALEAAGRSMFLEGFFLQQRFSRKFGRTSGARLFFLGNQARWFWWALGIPHAKKKPEKKATEQCCQAVRQQ